MDRGLRLTGGGYLTSTVSVILLAIPAMESARESPTMLASLLAGMGLSVAGMAMRWRAHQLDSRRIKQTRAEVRRETRAA